MNRILKIALTLSLISVSAMGAPSLGWQPRTQTELALACLFGMGKQGCERAFVGTDVVHRAPHSFTPHEAAMLVSYCAKGYVNERVDRCSEGPLETIEYAGANTSGEDVYIVKFMHAQRTYVVTPPTPDGKIEVVWFLGRPKPGAGDSAKLQLQTPALAPRLIYRR